MNDATSTRIADGTSRSPDMTIIHPELVDYELENTIRACIRSHIPIIIELQREVERHRQPNVHDMYKLSKSQLARIQEPTQLEYLQNNAPPIFNIHFGDRFFKLNVIKATKKPLGCVFSLLNQRYPNFPTKPVKLANTSRKPR